MVQIYMVRNERRTAQAKNVTSEIIAYFEEEKEEEREMKKILKRRKLRKSQAHRIKSFAS